MSEILTITGIVIGISRYKMNRNLNRKWSDVKKKRIKDNNQREKE